MTEKSQFEHELEYLQAVITSGNQVAVLGSIASSLLRIATIQEAAHELSIADMNQQIEAVIEERAQAKAEEMEADKSKRGFIGRR